MQYSFVMGTTDEPQTATANGTSAQFDTAAQAASWIAAQLRDDETDDERADLAAAQAALRGGTQ